MFNVKQIGRVPLREQVNDFEQSRNYMVNVVGENVTRELLKKAIFSLTIGSNDILNYVQPSIPFFGGNKISPIAFQDSMISNLSIHIKVRIVRKKQVSWQWRNHIFRRWTNQISSKHTGSYVYIYLEIK